MIDDNSFEVISCEIRAQQCRFRQFNGQNSIKEAHNDQQATDISIILQTNEKIYTQIPRPHIQKKNRDKFNNN